MKTPHPTPVKLALGCLVVANVESSVLTLAKPSWFLVLGIPLLIFAWFMIWMIYRSENWARLLFLFMTAGWLVFLITDATRFISKTGLDAILSWSQTGLNLAAACLLVLRQSNDWFRRRGQAPLAS